MEDKLLVDRGEVRHGYQSFLSKQKLEKEGHGSSGYSHRLWAFAGRVSGSVGDLESAAPWSKILLQPRESFLYCRLSASGAWEGKRGLCGFFVARMTRSGGF
jgi:hypothetical protein